MAGQRKQEIVERAERLFSERGYVATTMRELAATMDLQGGSLYSHIEGKEELLWCILERAADEFLQAIGRVEQMEASAGERLRAAILAHVEVVTGRPDAATVYFHEWRALSEPRRGEFLARRRTYERRMRRLVAAAVDSGAFPAVDPWWGTMVVLSAVNWLYQWYDPDGPLAPNEIAARLTTVLLAGAPRPDGAEAQEQVAGGWNERHDHE